MHIRKAYQVINSEPPIREVPALYCQDTETPLKIHAEVASDGVRYIASIAIDRLFKSQREVGAFICTGVIKVSPGELDIQKFTGIVHPEHADFGSAILYVRDRRSEARTHQVF